METSAIHLSKLWRLPLYHVASHLQYNGLWKIWLKATRQHRWLSHVQSRNSVVDTNRRGPRIHQATWIRYMVNRVDASDGSSTHFTVSEWAMLERSDDGFSVAFRGAGLTWSQPNLFQLVAGFRACNNFMLPRCIMTSRSGLARLLPPLPPLSTVLFFTLSQALALPAGLHFVWVGGVTMVDWCSIDAMGSSYDPSNSREYDLVRYSILLGRVGWIRLNLTWDLSWDWLVWIPTCCSRGGWDLNEIHYLRFWDSPNRMFKWAIIATPIHFV